MAHIEPYKMARAHCCIACHLRIRLIMYPHLVRTTTCTPNYRGGSRRYAQCSVATQDSQSWHLPLSPTERKLVHHGVLPEIVIYKAWQDDRQIDVTASNRKFTCNLHYNYRTDFKYRRVLPYRMYGMYRRLHFRVLRIHYRRFPF